MFNHSSPSPNTTEMKGETEIVFLSEALEGIWFITEKMCNDDRSP